MNATSTRRDVLRFGTTAAASAASASIVAGGITLASQAMGAAPAAGFAAWGRAHSAYLVASKASDDHWEYVEEPAIMEVERRAPRPATSFSIPARNGQVATFTFDPHDPDKWNDTGEQFIDAVRPLKAQWQVYDRDAPLVHAEVGIEAIGEVSSDLLNAHSAAENRLFETPAPDLDAVLIKLELLWSDDRDQCPDLNALVLADVRRLTSREDR